MIVLDLSILNQKGTPMFNSDTFANRPAFGIVGRIFISTDTKEFYRDTGTSWELIGGPGSGTITGSGAATQVAFWNGASTITGSNNLYWDSTNNNLGINTSTPGNSLDVHGGTISTLGAFNQTTATNNTLLAFLNTDIPLWRIGNFYTGGANDFSVFDVIGNLQQFTIVNTTGQTFVGAKTTASGRLVVNSATADAHLQVVGANSPSIRIDNAGSGGTQRFVFGLATATNNFIQGATAGEFCISTQSAGNMLFGMWQTTNASEVMRITTANNLLVGKTTDTGERFQVQGTTLMNGSVTFSSSTGMFWDAANARLGIGTNTPTVSLDIRGKTRIQASGAAELDIIDGSNSLRLAMGSTQGFVGTLSSHPFGFFTGALKRGEFSTNGNLIIQNGGTFTDGGQRLQVMGTTSLNGETIIVSASGMTIRNGATDGFSFQQSAANSWSWTALTSNSNYNIQNSNVGIGTATPDVSSLLDVTSLSKGFLPPRMTTAQKNAISSPAAGLIVYDTTLNKLCVRTAATWETITSL
jgi:hypothetical protein